jgi:hypothetical protein
MDKSFETVVSEFGSAMAAGLKTYGKEWGGAMLQAWLLVLKSHEVDERELAAGAEHFLCKGGEMPTPGEFARWVLDRRDRQETMVLLEQCRLESISERERYQGELDARYGHMSLPELKAYVRGLAENSAYRALPAPEKEATEIVAYRDPEKEALIRKQIEVLKS